MFNNLSTKMNGLKRGALIVVEGVDRSGKSTQCKKLVESLNKHNVKANLITFPDRSTHIGGIIDKYLRKQINLADEAIHLLFCANRWEKKAEMEQLLKQGVTLIVDRYSFSGVVYSSIKKNMNLRWCQEPEKGLLKPDQVFLLMLSENEISQRPNFGDERYENKETQEKVATMYTDMSKEQADWDIIKADGTIDEVHEVLLQKVLKRVGEVGYIPLDSLNFKPHTQNGELTIV